MPTSYDDYNQRRHIAGIRRDVYYIKKIPAEELNYELCCVAVKKAAGDCEFFKWFSKKYSKFVDENLCKIAVSAEPKKEFIRSVEADEDPDGHIYYDNEYKYFDPVIKYVPEKFRTVDVCLASAKYDWRTLQFVPVAVQLTDQQVCETAVGNYDEIMTDDVDFSTENRKKIIFGALNKSVFEKFPNIFDGALTLENVSAKWAMSNPDNVKAILLKHPEHIEKLPKDFRKKHFNATKETMSQEHVMSNLVRYIGHIETLPLDFRKEHFDVIRDAVKQQPIILSYLSAEEQENLRDITRDMAQKHPEILAYLCADEQKALVDLVESALSKGQIKLRSVKPSVQVLIPETCVEKLTNDPDETHWLGLIWAREPTPGLNLMDLCPELQNQNADLISRLVCEHLELLEYVDINVLIAHPEICVAAIEKFGAVAYEKIPQVVFDKNPDLYEQLLSKCPPLLHQFPKNAQTRERWTGVCQVEPRLAMWAPTKYMTVKNYEIAFMPGNGTHDLSDVPPRFRTYEVCKLAVQNSSCNLTDVPTKIKKDHPDVCEIVIANRPYEIKQVPEKAQLQNLYLCRLAVTGDPMSLKSVKPSVKRKHPEVCLWAMAQLIADFGFMDAAKLEAKRDTLRSYIPRDVLEKHWDFIHNTRGVITVKKTDPSR